MSISLFDILNLFSDLFDLCLELYCMIGNIQIVCFGKRCICFSVHFLGNKVKLTSDTATFQLSLLCSLDMAAQTNHFFIYTNFICKQGHFH